MLVFLMGIENIDARCKLEELYLKYHKEMYYIAIGILNNTHDAQDAVQSSILKLVSYIEKINEVNELLCQGIYEPSEFYETVEKLKKIFE